MLTVLAALILVATTGISGIATVLRTTGVPKIFILQLLLIYRYTAVLGEEAGRMERAYSLQSAGRKSIVPAHWGSFCRSAPIARCRQSAARLLFYVLPWFYRLSVGEKRAAAIRFVYEPGYTRYGRAHFTARPAG